METITVPRKEYDELRRKAVAYDKIAARNSLAGRKSSAKLTPEQRSERAKKAVAARIAKYGQQTRTGGGTPPVPDANPTTR